MTKLKFLIVLPLLLAIVIVISSTFGTTSSSFYRSEHSESYASVGNLDLNYRLTKTNDEIEISDIIVGEDIHYNIHLQNDTNSAVQYEIWYSYGNYTEVFDLTGGDYTWVSYCKIGAGDSKYGTKMMNTSTSQISTGFLQTGEEATIDINFDVSSFKKVLENYRSKLNSSTAAKYVGYVEDLQIETEFKPSLRIYAYNS